MELNKLFEEVGSSRSVIEARDKIFENAFYDKIFEDAFENVQSVSKIKKKRIVAAVSNEDKREAMLP